MNTTPGTTPGVVLSGVGLTLCPFGALSEPQVLKQRARSDEDADSWLAQLSLPWPPSLKRGFPECIPGG